MEKTCPLCGRPITRGQTVMLDESDVEWHAGCYTFSHPHEEDSANG